jgi:hypothetical protein
MRKLLMAAVAALLCLGMAAGTASAKPKNKPQPKPKPEYTYTATIDCGRGPVSVGSYDDMWADLEDLDSKRRYKPIEWHVKVGDMAIDESKPGERRRQPRVVCSYDDGMAKGTVVVKYDIGFLLDDWRDVRSRYRD